MGNSTSQPDRYHCDGCSNYTRAMDGFKRIESIFFSAPTTEAQPDASKKVSRESTASTSTSHDVSTYRSLDNAGDVVTEAVAGVVSGTAGVLATQPFDTVKVKMQCFPERYKGVIDCLSQTVARGGARDLYAGTLPSLVTEVCENALVFPLYCMSHTLVEVFHNFIASGTQMLRWTMISSATNARQKSEQERGTKLRTFFDSLISGAFAGGALSLVLAPAELVKCKLQSHHEAASAARSGKTNNLWNISLSIPLSNAAAASAADVVPHQRVSTYSVIRTVLAVQGPSGLFRGLSSTCLRELSGYSVFFASYELGTQLAYGEKAHDDLHLVGATVFGALSGGLGWTVCLPFDVVKSRVQAGLAPPQFGAAFRQIVRREGLRALFLGYTPALIRVMPQNGIIMLVYETIRMFGRDFFDSGGEKKQQHATKD